MSFILYILPLSILSVTQISKSEKVEGSKRKILLEPWCASSGPLPRQENGLGSGYGLVVVLGDYEGGVEEGEHGVH